MLFATPDLRHRSDKMDPVKTSADGTAIDHIERPSAN
jgi:hypothetical protein